MKANRWLCLLLAICLIFTLTACSGGGGGSDDDNNDADTWPVEFYRSTVGSSVSAMRVAPATGSYKYIYFYENGTYKSGDLNNGTLTQTGSGTYTGGDPHGSVTLSLTGTYEGNAISGKTVVISSSSLTIDGQTFARSDSNTTPDGGGSGDPVNPSSDSNDYLCFTANADGCSISTSITVSSSFTPTLSLEYSTDKKNWEPFIINNSSVSLIKTGDKVYIRATSSNPSFSEVGGYISFVISGSVSASGNIMSLLNKNCGGDSVPDFSFYCLFENNKTLTTAPAFPATDLKQFCYAFMFDGCTSLTTAPALPATNLADFCYLGMFRGCSALTTAPALPAKNLAKNCYAYMFSDCSSLIKAPALLAVNLEDDCYAYMFEYCTSLTTAPSLPATTLAEGCYAYMFDGCTSLTTAPVLPATDLESDCYSGMFYGCSELSSITVYFTKWVDDLGNDATKNWVYGVNYDDDREWEFHCRAKLINHNPLINSDFGESRIPKDSSHRWNVIKDVPEPAP